MRWNYARFPTEFNVYNIFSLPNLRMDCVWLTVLYAAWNDAVEDACKAKIGVIAQPGGSMRDQDAIEWNEYGVVMLTTGIRHFRHKVNGDDALQVPTILIPLSYSLIINEIIRSNYKHVLYSTPTRSAYKLWPLMNFESTFYLLTDMHKWLTVECSFHARYTNDWQ